MMSRRSLKLGNSCCDQLSHEPHRQVHATNRSLPLGGLQMPLFHNSGVENLSVVASECWFYPNHSAPSPKASQ